MRWGLFQTAEYINMIVLSALCVTLFFGGWHFPWVHSLDRFGPIWFLLKLGALVTALHLAARLAAAPALRPADALRLEDPAARSRPSTPWSPRCSWSGSSDERRRPEHAQGLRRHAEAGLQEADHAAVPGVQAARSTRASAAATACTCTRTGSRSASAARSAPPPARPTASASSPAENTADEPRLGRRALRAHLRDQHEPLHLLRLLRARLPVRRDHARQRLRDLRVQPRRPDLHEGHAARRRRSSACRSPTATSTTRRSPTTRTNSLDGRTSSSGCVWFAAAFACLASALARRQLPQPVLLGARADREPRLARRALPAARRRVRRRGARCSSTAAR